MEVVGKIKFIDTTKEVGTTFKKRDIAVTTDEQYPQHILLQFVQDKCDLLNGYKVGESVKIDINLRGREWTNPQGETVYFNTLQGWRIESLSSGTPSENYTKTVESSKQFAPPVGKENEPDDMPF